MRLPRSARNDTKNLKIGDCPQFQQCQMLRCDPFFLFLLFKKGACPLFYSLFLLRMLLILFMSNFSDRS
jgi:hypothetical protein